VSNILAVESQGLSHETSDLEVSSLNSQWYAVFTMPRHEKRIVTHCRGRNIESFLPLYHVRHRWKNRCNATVELPLFPNYCFVHIGPQERGKVLRLPGVMYIVSSGRELLPIPDEYINSLRDGLLAYRIEPHPNVEAGDRVCITRGPMKGMEGILDRNKNGVRVIIRLEMIGRSVAVEVGAEEIAHAGAGRIKSALVDSYEFASGIA